MKSTHGRSRLFYKYLLSYIVILFIPILIFTMLIYNSFLNILTREVLGKNEDMLIQVKDSIDSQMSELWKISANLGNNPDLPKVANDMDPVSGMKLVQYVTNYSFSNNFAEEMLLYFRGGNYIYSPSGTYTVDNFIDSIYQYSGWEKDEFYQEINTVAYPVVKPVNDVIRMFSNKERYITYMLPVSPSPINQYATVIFLINEKTAQNMMKTIVSSHGGNVVILDDEGNIISCLENHDYFNTELFKKQLNRNDEFYTDTIKLDKVDYYFSSVKSNNTKWRYITIIPVSEVVEKPSALKTQALFGMVLIFLTGSIIIFGVMYINYTPIKKLKKFTEEKLGHKLAASNELESVRQAIEDMSSSAKAMHTRIENSRSALKEDLLLNLMNGRFANLDEFNEKGKEIDVLFTWQFFFAGIFNIKNFIGIERAEVVKEIEAYFLPEIEGYGKDSMDESSIIFIFSSDEIDYSHLEDKFMQLRTHLFNNWNIEATIGIGNLYRLPGEIGKSYIEASTAMDYRLIKGKNRVIMFNEIFQYQKNMNHYSDERLEQLEFCLLQGNVEKVDEILDGIVAYIDNDNISLFMVRSICFDIINTVIKAVNRFKKEYSNEISYPDVITLTRFDTINELVEIVQQISNDIYIRVKEQKNQRRNQIEQIMKYINLNYDNYSFSIQNMSDHFQVSLSNMSHYFKDQAGENISDYVNNLRMKKAKKLLAETDECLQDIVDKIGYTNVSSFIRKFKQATSITPGEFRELSKNNLKER